MSLDADWKKAMLRVVQATNVALVYSPNATSCISVRDLNINALQTYLGIAEDSLVSTDDYNQDRIEPNPFIWAVLHKDNASFCPKFDCDVCLRRIRQMKLATCLAIVQTREDFPSSLKPTLDAGADWAFIHSSEPQIPLEDTLTLRCQQSSITPKLLLTTISKQSSDSHFDELHQWHRQRVEKGPGDP